MLPPAPTSTPPAHAAATLTRNCEGYPAGTTGLIAGSAQGCLVFAPDEPHRVARWARPRATLLVPVALIAVQVVSSLTLQTTARSVLES